MELTTESVYSSNLSSSNTAPLFDRRITARRKSCKIPKHKICNNKLYKNKFGTGDNQDKKIQTKDGNFSLWDDNSARFGWERANAETSTVISIMFNTESEM